MKTTWMIVLLTLALILTACTAPAPRPAATQAANPPVGAPSNETAATEVVSLPLVVGPSNEAAATQAVSLPLVEAPSSDMATQAVNLPLVVGAGEAVVLNTSLGMLEVVSSRFVDEVNSTKPGPGQKILLVILDRPGDERLTPDNFSLEAFDQARSEQINGQQVHVLTDSGEMIITTMGGWTSTSYDEFAMGFMVPDTAKTFQLIWPENAPVVIAP